MLALSAKPRSVRPPERLEANVWERGGDAGDEAVVCAVCVRLGGEYEPSIEDKPPMSTPAQVVLWFIDFRETATMLDRH